MKKLLIIIGFTLAVYAYTVGLGAVILSVGCTSAPVTVTPRHELIANAVEDVLTVGLVPVLTKNPGYVRAAQSVALTLGTFSGETLFASDIDAFIAKVAIAPEDAKVVSGIVNAAWSVFQKRYAQQVGASVRPDVKLFLAAVSRGILSACAAVPKA